MRFDYDVKFVGLEMLTLNCSLGLLIDVALTCIGHRLCCGLWLLKTAIL